MRQNQLGHRRRLILGQRPNHLATNRSRLLRRQQLIEQLLLRLELVKRKLAHRSHSIVDLCILLLEHLPSEDEYRLAAAHIRAVAAEVGATS